jgi:DNA-binding transcriptional LysR family regulator
MSPRRERLSLEQLESFVAVAEEGGVTAAARRLGISQPTVSQHLQRLEMRLGRVLVQRGPAGAVLSVEGARLLPLARGLLRLDDQFDGENIRLRLGACSNIGVYLLPQHLKTYRDLGHELPEVRIASNPEIVASLISGEVDLAMLEWWEPRAGFEAARWRDEPLVAILPEDDPLAEAGEVLLTDFCARPLLGGETGTGTARLLRAALPRGAELEVSFQLGSTEAVKRAVAAGLGVSLILKSCVGEVPSGLVVRPLSPTVVKPLCLVWRNGIAADDALLVHLKRQSDRP